MARVGDYIEASAPVSPSTSGAEVYERFQAEPNTLVLAVVDADGRPVGLVERNAFTLRMAAAFGRELYARRPISALMNTQFALARIEDGAEAFFAHVDSADAASLMSGFVAVSRDGRYAGVGAILQVLQAGSALYRRRAEEMAELARGLSKAEAEARASSRAKSEFLAVMSHEIRTPLNGVLGVAALMQRKLTQDELRPHIDTIVDSGQSLLRLLTDALDMSRAQAGVMTIEAEPLSLTGLADDLRALWAARAEEKSLALEIETTVDACGWVMADATRLKQLLNNLIGNAIKFTAAGRVAVRLHSERIDGAIRLNGVVDDSGPGIPAAALSRIFEPFNTGEANREGAGAGMGLAICRQIAERMDGAIVADEAPGGGARFGFHVILQEADPALRDEPEAMAEPTEHETLHVLVADDNATNRFLAGKLLELFGCTHEAVENGAEALARIQRARFDLVLMDIKMPVMNGVEATRAIRALDDPAGATPILALTANADEGDALAYEAAGMDGVVQKPIQPDVLLNAIRRVLAAEPPTAVAA